MKSCFVLKIVNYGGQDKQLCQGAIVLASNNDFSEDKACFVVIKN